MPLNITSPLIQLLLNGALTGNGTTILQTLLVQVFLSVKAKAAATSTPWDDAILEAIIAAANEVKKLEPPKP
jgi:hypothetical protein